MALRTLSGDLKSKETRGTDFQPPFCWRPLLRLRKQVTAQKDHLFSTQTKTFKTQSTHPKHQKLDVFIFQLETLETPPPIYHPTYSPGHLPTPGSATCWVPQSSWPGRCWRTTAPGRCWATSARCIRATGAASWRRWGDPDGSDTIRAWNVALAGQGGFMMVYVICFNVLYVLV